MANPLSTSPPTAVAVLCRFDGSWVEGFEIADIRPDEPAPYALRRIHDGAQLPAWFGPDDLCRSPWTD